MKQATVLRWFRIGLIVKGIDGLLEMLGGILFWFVDPRTINDVVGFLTTHELSNDPSDRVMTTLRHASAYLETHPTHFASIYLTGHGLVKVLLVVSLLGNRRWAYVPALVLMGAFVAYELYRFAHTQSLGLLFFTATDVAVMYFVWREYRRSRHADAGAGVPPVMR